MIRAAEFFAGMGLMRAGLEGNGIETVFANDICPTKAALYRDNWGDDALHVGDIRALHGNDIPDIELATASFPCTDLSLAGRRKGLQGEQSGSVMEFLRILGEMEKRAPKTILIENVPGFLTANNGRDWETVVSGLRGLGYTTGHTIINADSFVPQSRARVFLVANQGRVSIPLSPERRNDLRLVDFVDDDGDWWPAPRLTAFLGSLSPLQEARVTDYRARPDTGFFGAFRRTRNGAAVWEIRADEKAGALRTTRGGSAKQALLRAGLGNVAARWMSVTEYARLQGAENFRYGAVTPGQAMFALGDAVCVPVVRWLTEHCLLPTMQR